MPKGTNQKRKLMVLARFLLKHSDEEHPLTLGQLQEELERWNAPAERKSIYDDMEQLRQLGLDVQTRRGVGGGWFIGQRDFELAELKLLVDAVQSSRFLTQKKSSALIGKLESLASVHQARQLQRQVYVDRRAKTMNEHIFYNVDKLHTAIAVNREVTFRYFEYNMRKQKVYRRGGERYRVTPFGLIWDNENYYLAGFDHLHREMRHYRVDKMLKVEPLFDTRREGAEEYANFDVNTYVQQTFGMFNGPIKKVTLKCENRLAGAMIDRFGTGPTLVPYAGGEAFVITVDVQVSPQFYGWVAGFGAGIEILSPPEVRAEMRKTLDTLETI